MAEVFYNQNIGTTGYICQNCGMYVVGSHQCQTARTHAPMDPMWSTLQLQRIADALERIADHMDAPDNE